MMHVEPGSGRGKPFSSTLRRIKTALQLASQLVVHSASRFPRAVVKVASYVGLLLTLWDRLEDEGGRSSPSEETDGTD